MNNFEYAVRNKLRFPFKGQISIEDLFDLSVEDIDKIYKTLKVKKKELDENSYSIFEDVENTETKESKNIDVSIEILRSVAQEKIDEKNKRENEIINKAKKEKLMEILERKRNADLENKSEEELLKMIEDME